LKTPTLAKNIAKLTLTKKAADVVLMDLRGLTTMSDFFVVCSADSDTQMKAIASAVEDGMEKKGVSPWHREAGSAQWVLLDYVDVVLHIFHKNARPYYNLERLWGDAAMERISDPGILPPKRAVASARPRRAGASRKRVAG
jgi:ribosome-associated protein